MFRRLNFNNLCAFKRQAEVEFKFCPNEVHSKYLEISSKSLTVEGHLPSIRLNCGPQVIRTYYTTTFVVTFNPALRLGGTYFLEFDLQQPDQLLFGTEFATVKVDPKKAESLSWICRVYQIEDKVL